MFKLSEEGIELVKKELLRYETKRSAIITCLFRVQEENQGWVSPECVTYLSGLMDLPESWINEVLCFYTMFNKKPVGKLHVQVCCNISCCMNGGRELAQDVAKAFEVEEGVMEDKGLLTISRVECLGSCDTAPMMQVNDKYYENLTSEKAIQIIKDLSE